MPPLLLSKLRRNMFTPPSTKTIIIFLISFFNHLWCFKRKWQDSCYHTLCLVWVYYRYLFQSNETISRCSRTCWDTVANTNTVYHRVAATFQMIHIPLGVISSPSAPTNPSGNRKSVDCSCELLQSFVFLSASCSTNLLWHIVHINCALITSTEQTLSFTH